MKADAAPQAKTVTPATDTLTTAYASGYESKAIPCGKSKKGRLLGAVDVSASITTLTLLICDVQGDDANVHERLRSNAGTAELDEIAITVADLTDVGAAGTAYFAIPIDCEGASRIVVRAKVDDATGSPTLALVWYPDNQLL